MKQVLVLLAFVAAVAAQGEWTHGLRVRFGIGSGYFMEVPRTVLRADEMNWTSVEPPTGPYPELFMRCAEDRIICALYDDSQFVAGLQIALPQSDMTPTYDMATQGYVEWSVDGVSYWTNTQYFVSEVTLQKSVAQRAADISDSTNPKTLREDAVWVNNVNGGLLKISSSRDDIINSSFTAQQCIPLMGRHYYYEMTTDYVCSDTMLPYFTCTDSTDLVALGFMGFGTLTNTNGALDWFESPNSLAIQVIVPNGPQCLWDLPDEGGLVTLHVYYIDNPLLINCLI